jgi:histidinol-phosphatase (PHP family)
MKYRYISDSHTHSDCSRDGDDPTMMICESGARQGLYAMTITDHCECNAYTQDGYDRSIRQSYFEARKAAAVFHSRLHVFAGVEIGQPMQNQAAAQDVLDACDFDFVLASVHNVKSLADFYELDYSKIEVNDALNRYFDEMMDMIEWGKFDSLAHLTYPWRYIVGERGLEINDNLFRDRIDQVLMALIKKHKALEVNTSGFRQKLGKPMPDLSIIRRYRELGGKLITIGSDAHRWADVGGGVEQGLRVLQQAGFHHFTIYIHREPKFLPIE